MPKCTPAAEEAAERPRTADSAPTLAARAEERRPLRADDALHRRTGDARYADLYATWWDHIATHVVDHERGSWHHELDATLAPAGTVWPGKPDLYHAVQATLLPRLPLGPSIARAVADGRVA